MDLLCLPHMGLGQFSRFLSFHFISFPFSQERFINLGPYVNTSVFVVPHSFSLNLTYNVFRSMGLRHLVVVDYHNSVVGIITRKV